MNDDLVDFAFRRSKKTICKFKVCAICYDRRGNLLGISYNIPRFNRHGGGIHAEMKALQKWGTSIHRITLLRFGKSGDLLPIDPCINCAKVLNKLKIKVVTLVDQ